MGCFSLGLGTLQLLLPDAVNKLCGLPAGGVRRTTQRMIGVRELLAAGGLLTHSNRPFWMKARVVGDVTDLTLLAKSLGSSNRRPQTTLAMAAVVGVTAVDVIGACRRPHSRRKGALEAIQAQAGHWSIESTRVYLHLADDWLADEYRRAAELIDATAGIVK